LWFEQYFLTATSDDAAEAVAEEKFTAVARQPKLFGTHASLTSSINRVASSVTSTVASSPWRNRRSHCAALRAARAAE
jgi:hypothetical protein